MSKEKNAQLHMYPTTGFIRKSALFWMHILKNTHFISRKKKLALIQNHFSHNSLAFETYSKSMNTPYIERQRELTDLFYGWELKGRLGTFLKKNAFDGETLCAAHNACEVIAVYNALVALNDEHSPIAFPELLSHFEKNGMTLSGNFGTDPRSIYRYLKKTFPAYAVEMYKRKKIDSVIKARTYIVTFWNDPKDIFYGIHTVCITENNGLYCIHNNRKEHVSYSSFDEALSNYKGCIVSVITIT